MNFKLIKEITLESNIAKNIDIDDTDLENEKVMMNLHKGEYFIMNEVGSRIWDILENPRRVKEIVSLLLSEYDVDNKECEKAVIVFLQSLNKSDLITVK